MLMLLEICFTVLCLAHDHYVYYMLTMYGQIINHNCIAGGGGDLVSVPLEIVTLSSGGGVKSNFIPLFGNLHQKVPIINTVVPEGRKGRGREGS